MGLRGPLHTKARQGGWYALAAGPPSSGSLLRYFSFLPKNRQKVSSNSENFYFCRKTNTTTVLLKTAPIRVSSMQIIQKPYRIVVKLEMAHTNLLRTRKYRIQVDMVDSYGKTGFKDFGCTSSISTQYKWRLANRFRSNQPRNKNSHKRALSITNTK